MLVWTVSNQKGGVGKTTTAITLGGLAAVEGKRALLLDLDPHCSLGSWLRQQPDAPGENIYTLFQAPKLSRQKVRACVVATPYENISLMRASTLLATLERQSIGMGRGLVISQALELIADDYDLVILDCPPQLGVLMVNALAVCHQLIIPVQTEFLAIKGLDRILHTIFMMSQSLGKVIPYLIVPTMFDRRTHASVSSLHTIRHQHGEHVWPGIIQVDTRLRDASHAGVPPNIYDPQSRASENYGSLYRYLQRDVCAKRAPRAAHK